MQTLCDLLLNAPPFAGILDALIHRRIPALGGLSAAHKAHFIGAAARATGAPVVVLCPDEAEARRLTRDLGVWSGREVRLLPSREFVFRTFDTVSHPWEHDRLAALYALQGDAPLVVAPFDAFLRRTLPPEVLKAQCLTLSRGRTLSPEALVERLVTAGYESCLAVEGVGQFARRGGLVDVFPPGSEHPLRVDFFGDEIDALYRFDVNSQRRVETVRAADILPVSEVLPHTCEGGFLPALRACAARSDITEAQKKQIESDIERYGATGRLPDADRYMGLIYKQFATPFDHLPENTLLFVSESRRIAEGLKNSAALFAGEMEALLSDGAVAARLGDFQLDADGFWAACERAVPAFLDTLPVSSLPVPVAILETVTAKEPPSYGGHVDMAVSDIDHLIGQGVRVAVLTGSKRQAESMADLLARRKIPTSLDFTLSAAPEPGHCVVGVGLLSAGMEYPTANLAILSEGQFLSAAPRKVRSTAKSDSRARVASYTDLTPGDFIVHEHHGIGRFVGIVKMPVDGVERDYIQLAYAGGDGLYVPVTALHLVSKYIGAGEGEAVRLNRLGGADWQKAKIRAKAAAKDLAEGLIKLYAERKKQPGFAFAKDGEDQAQFEDAFEFVETADQLRCTREIKGDMESPFPMDRLLCGDVGFGKTEVALRAVMKCILNGKQAAILVPTTVLARQHVLTATERFREHAVSIAQFSRFVAPKELKETARKLSEGQVDLIVGTHKLLGKTLKFKDLGLLIIDEEQRFGVSQKERIKEMSRQVDVLTLTATPIPRTLNMALSGIRDMSVIEEPPRNRHPVQTHVLEHDVGVLCDAIRREVSRGGQVYYVHNRVETIERTAAKLHERLPDVTMAVAHGQMSDEMLEDIMQRMSEGEVQVLVCTTIIETGIDIPNVNTLIVEDADRMGLAQLHQIRGRVGRSVNHAYAYLTYRRGKVLSEIATKRLSAIREFAEFGSGFKISMRDLEIRGAGNVLGPEQHGHLMSVGYDMYLKLLDEAVQEAKGEVSAASVDCQADLNVEALIAERYVPSSGDRIDLYRRTAAVRTQEEADDLIEELTDRFGAPPKKTRALIRIALLRAAASRLGVTDINQKDGRVFFKMPVPDFKRVAAVCSASTLAGRVLFSAGEEPYLSLRLKNAREVLEEAEGFVEALGGERGTGNSER